MALLPWFAKLFIFSTILNLGSIQYSRVIVDLLGNYALFILLVLKGMKNLFLEDEIQELRNNGSVEYKIIKYDIIIQLANFSTRFVFKLKKMFGGENGKINWNIQESKNQQFRVEIRRKYMNQVFASSRKQCMASMKSLKFLYEVKNAQDHYQMPQQLQQLIQGLEKGQDNISFYENIRKLELQIYLCNIAKNSHIALTDRSRVLKILVHLTFYCFSSLYQILKEVDLIEELTDSINELSPERSEDIEYLESIIKLMVNITAAYNKDVNYFLIESGFMKRVLVYIQKISRCSLELAESIRIYGLLLHLNLFSKKNLDSHFIISHLAIILDDKQYHHNNIGLIFRCLKNVSKIQGIWDQINEIEPYIFFNLGDIMGRLRDCTNEEYEEFLDFINEVMLNSDFGLDIYDFMDPDLLLKKIKEFHHPLNSKNKLRILKSVQVFSNLVNTHVLIKEFFHTPQEVSEFIRMLMNGELALHPKYGKYCTRNLVKLLTGDKYLLNQMLDHGLLDHLVELLEQKFKVELIIEGINLIQKVMEVWEDMKASQWRTAVDITAMIHGKGLIVKIEGFQNRDEQELFDRAQEFMKWVDHIN